MNVARRFEIFFNLWINSMNGSGNGQWWCPRVLKIQLLRKTEIVNKNAGNESSNLRHTFDNNKTISKKERKCRWQDIYSGLMAYVDCSFVLVFFVSFFCCRCCSKKDRNQNHLLPLLAAQWYSFEGKLAMVLLPRQSSTLQREKKSKALEEHPLHYDILSTLQLFLLHRTMNSRWRASLMSIDWWRKTIFWPYTRRAEYIPGFVFYFLMDSR